MRYLTKAILFTIIVSASNVFAATYYVKPDGNDNANGRSDATAWKTINKVNSYAFNAGDDVYLLSGGNWNSQLVVDWDGTPANQAIVGSYYMDINGTETIGIKPGTSKPTLAGSYPVFEVSGAVPAARYPGMVQVYANYVTIQNLRVENSSGTGINLSKEQHHAIFENNEVDVTAGSSILFQRRTHSNIMRNNKMHKCGQGWKDNLMDGTWPVCNGAIGSKNNLIENNLITGSYGEGIVAFGVGADNNIIRGNTVVVIHAVGIYVDNGSNNIVENNIVVGESANGKTYGSAFALNVEDYPYMNDATGNIFRNNMAANTAVCFWMGLEPDALAKGYKIGGDFIGNTCVGMDKTLGYSNSGNAIQKFNVSNNIFSGMVNNLCKFPSSPNISFNNNLWQVQPSDADCWGNNDIIADPKLSKSSGWENTKPSNIPKAADFIPQSMSLAYGKGKSHANLPKDYFGNIRSFMPAIGAVDENGADISTTILNVPKGLSMSIF